MAVRPIDGDELDGLRAIKRNEERKIRAANSAHYVAVKQLADELEAERREIHKESERLRLEFMAELDRRRREAA